MVFIKKYIKQRFGDPKDEVMEIDVTKQIHMFGFNLRGLVFGIFGDTFQFLLQ